MTIRNIGFQKRCFWFALVTYLSVLVREGVASDILYLFHRNGTRTMENGTEAIDRYLQETQLLQNSHSQPWALILDFPWTFRPYRTKEMVGTHWAARNRTENHVRSNNTTESLDRTTDSILILVYQAESWWPQSRLVQDWWQRQEEESRVAGGK